jgi:hypothetical protein
MNYPTVLPRGGPTREEIAKIEIGQTTVSPAVARALVAFFLVAIAAVPAIETFSGPARSSVWAPLLAAPARIAEAVQTAQARGIATLWSRTVTANRAALSSLVAFERALEQESLIGRALRPPAQWLLSGWLGAGNERVYVGREGWTFYRPDVEYLTGPGFLDAHVLRRRVAAAKEWTAPVQPDPRPAILAFHRELAARGITLVLVPTPVKPAIHPDKLVASLTDSAEPLQNRSYSALVDSLVKDGVLIFDPAAVLFAAKRSGSQYLATDTHWRPEAMELVAERLSAFVNQHVTLPPSVAPGWRIEEREVSSLGDTAVMLDLPSGQQLYPAERVTISRVVTADGGAWRSDRSADVLVLGDSFANIYSLASLGWGDSAGLVEQLSYVLGRPIDRIIQNDDGAFATREMLRQSGADRLSGKRVVIWQFAARELAFGDWRVIH